MSIKELKGRKNLIQSRLQQVVNSQVKKLARAHTTKQSTHTVKHTHTERAECTETLPKEEGMRSISPERLDHPLIFASQVKQRKRS